VRVQLEPAYVLSVRAYRETSALVEAFTAAHGRVGLVARGVRGAKSKLRGVLQPFRQVLLSWNESGELGTLTGAEAVPAAGALEGEAVFSGWYLNELLLRLLARRDPHPGLFASYARALAAQAGAGGQDPASRALAASAALRVFEKHLLSELGYGLQFPESFDRERWYEYDDGAGFAAVAEPTPSAYRGSSLQALSEESLQAAEDLSDAKRLLRAALAQHLGGRELKTPQMLRALRHAGRRP